MADCGPDDILTAAAICAGESYETTLAEMLDGRWLEKFKRWSQRIQGGPFRKPIASGKSAEELFRAYLVDGYQRPPVWTHVCPESIELTAPWPVHLKCSLVMNGFAESEVMNAYLPAAWYDYFAVLELRQAERCREAKNWRKVFYTPKDADRINGVSHE